MSITLIIIMDTSFSGICMKSDKILPYILLLYPLEPLYIFFNNIRWNLLLQEPHESLGISVAGGLCSPRGDVPVYVTNINPNGCLGRTRQVKVIIFSSYIYVGSCRTLHLRS